MYRATMQIKMQNKTGGPGVELWGGSRRITSRSRRAAFAALTPPPTDTLGSASVCGSAWSLADIMPPVRWAADIVSAADYPKGIEHCHENN